MSCDSDYSVEKLQQRIFGCKLYFLNLLIQNRNGANLFVLSSSYHNQQYNDNENHSISINHLLDGFKNEINQFITTDKKLIQFKKHAITTKDILSRSSIIQVTNLDRYRFRIDTSSLMKKYLSDYDILVYIRDCGAASSTLTFDDLSQQHHHRKNNNIEIKYTSNQFRDLLDPIAETPILNRSSYQRARLKEKFDCQICLSDDLDRKEKGFLLKNCPHVFCKECLIGYIVNSEDLLNISCPYVAKEAYSYGFIKVRKVDTKSVCDKEITPIEIDYLLKNDLKLFSNFYKRKRTQVELVNRSLSSASSKRRGCQTPDCQGKLVENDSFSSSLSFTAKCSVCSRFNCFKCERTFANSDDHVKCISESKTTKDDENLKELFDAGLLMRCPKCNVLLEKQDSGCQFIRCFMCRLDICWLTKLPRWGPNGKGDISGGCKCGRNGLKCHPDCVNCH